MSITQFLPVKQALPLRLLTNSLQPTAGGWNASVSIVSDTRISRNKF